MTLVFNCELDSQHWLLLVGGLSSKEKYDVAMETDLNTFALRNNKHILTKKYKLLLYY